MSPTNRIGLLASIGGTLLFGVAWFLLAPIAGCLGMDDKRNAGRKPLAEYDLPARHSALGGGFSPDGKEIVVHTRRVDEGDGKGFIHFFDAESGKLLVTMSQPSHVRDFGFFAEGKKLLTAPCNGGGFHVFAGKEWGMVDTLDGPMINQIKILPDGKRVAAAVGGWDGPKIWDLETKKAVSFPAPGKHPGFDLNIRVAAIDVSPDGKRLAVALWAPRVELYDIETVKVAATLAVDSGIFTSVRYSPDGKRIAAGYNNKEGVSSIHLWDTATHKLLHTCTAEKMRRGPEYLLFTPDGKYVLAVAFEDLDKPVRTLVWATDTGKLVETLEPGFGGGALAFSPDGTVLVTLTNKDRRIQKWDFAAIRKDFEAKAEKK